MKLYKWNPRYQFETLRDVKSVTSTFYDNHKHPEIRNNISAASNEDIAVVNEWVMTRERERKRKRGGGRYGARVSRCENLRDP